MSATNKTPNYELPQWVGSDHPTWQGDLNSAFLTIDNALESQQSSIDSLTSIEGGEPVQYVLMTCDLWDYGTVAAKEGENPEPQSRISRLNRRY